MASKDDASEADAGQARGAGSMKLVILVGIVAFVAALGAQVAAPTVLKMLNDEGHADGAAPSAPTRPALYTPLDPPFVVSFADEEYGTRFLQLTMQAMARDERSIDAIKQHAPALRNAFLFLISRYEVEELSTLEGKEKLRAEMLAKAQEIMTENAGKPSIEDLYFTSLVIQ
jgi:flagellar FliL protein